ncbi:sodium:calcium antiporter [Myxococcota bacterium]|nr:sodium:calcium antiporter [Myxococcota bacterium]
MLIALLLFTVCGGVVVAAGTALARYSDSIAEATGIGRLWVGSILLAMATSLPELATDISAVRMGVPDLAVGDLFGSGLANMLILALVDLLPARGRLLREATLDHALAANVGIVLTALAAALLLMRLDGTVLGVDPGGVVLILVYVGGTRAIYYHGRRRENGAPPASAPEAHAADPAVRRAALRAGLRGFLAATVAILVAAPAFAWSAARIAELTGLGASFVGTLLVGFSTSLPELVASLAAVRLGSFDLAVGNLFGSNGFNMLVFPVLDVVQGPGSFFRTVGPEHAITAMFVVVLMSLGLAGIVYRAERRFSALEPTSLLMVLVYGVAVGVLYFSSGAGV